jgi:hypothetical protein
MRTTEELAANARLIAASPEMADALKWVLYYLREARQNAFDDRAAVPIACAYSAAYDALQSAGVETT